MPRQVFEEGSTIVLSRPSFLPALLLLLVLKYSPETKHLFEREKREEGKA